MTAPRPPEARALLDSWRATVADALATGALGKGGKIVADVQSGDMLCLLAQRVPPGTIDPAFLAGEGRDLFTPAGAEWWLRLHGLAALAAARVRPRIPGGRIAAVFLHPDAFDQAARP